LNGRERHGKASGYGAPRLSLANGGDHFATIGRGEFFVSRLDSTKEFWLGDITSVLSIANATHDQPARGAGAELQSGQALLTFRYRTAHIPPADLKVLTLK
jgi:hypothetical protein